MLHVSLIFTEFSPRPIQSMSYDVRLSIFLCVCPLQWDSEPHEVKTSGQKVIDKIEN